MGKAALQAAGWHNASKQFVAHLRSTVSGVSKVALDEYGKCAEDVISQIEEREMYPFYTGNLHDSIAVAIYRRSAIARVSITETMATKPQHTPTRKRIVGVDEAYKMIRSHRPKESGITATLFVAVPYAEGANKYSNTRRFLRYGLLEYTTKTVSSKAGYLDDIESTFNAVMSRAEKRVSDALRKKPIVAKKTYSTSDIFKMAGIKF